MKHFRRHLTYANVMSSIAVFLMLGGATAFAASKIGPNQLKANSVKTGKIVKEAVTTGKLKKNAVTTDKIADLAVTTPKLANDAVTGDKVNESTLSTVPNATNATNAANLQHPEAFHIIGASGQPGFQGGFVNFGGGYETAGFYLDRQCVVHLKGAVSGSPGVAFTLPPGFRPPEATFAAVPATGEAGNIQIFTDGSVSLGAPTAGSKNFGLTGVNFRVAGC